MTCAETRPVDFETGWQVGIGKEQEWIEAAENSPAWLCLSIRDEALKAARGAFRLSRVGSQKMVFLTCSGHGWKKYSGTMS